MKKIMEMLQNMKAKNEKKDNKGFSLVELIIVIASMAILVGIGGTQVLPYLNKSKEAKDLQIVNSYSTAAVSAYSMLAGELKTNSGKLIVNVYTDKSADGATDKTDNNKLADKIIELTGYASKDALWDTTNKKGKMTSKTGQAVTGIEVTYDFDNHSVETRALGTSLDIVEADL